jgi:integrase
MTDRTTRRGKGDGSVYRRKDGYWVGAVDTGWNSGGRRRRYVYAKTRRDVIAKMRPLVRDAEANRLPSRRSPTVAEWMSTFMTEVAASAVRPSTLARYEQELRLYILPELGALRLDKVQPQHLSRFYRELLQVLSPNSVRRIHALLRHSMNVALRWGLVTTNPATLVDPPPIPHKEIQPLSLSEARRLLETAAGGSMYARWALAVTLGLRQGEALGLRWTDVDLENGQLRILQALQRQSGGQLVFVQPKTARSRRTIELTPSLIAAFQARRDVQDRDRAAAGESWKGSGLVFTTRTGGPIHPRNDYRAFRTLLDRAGIRRIRLHDLRHTAASLMLANGVQARIVMEVLGHSQISLTMNTYTHVSREGLHDAAERMERALGSMPQEARSWD